jgi:hypothetical protein
VNEEDDGTLLRVERSTGLRRYGDFDDPEDVARSIRRFDHPCLSGWLHDDFCACMDYIRGGAKLLSRR